MIRLADWIARVAQRVMPSPFVITIALTVIVAFLAIGIWGNGAIDVIDYWHGGFWTLLTFTMQMTLILTLGYALASAPPVRSLIDVLVRNVKSTRDAVIIVVSWSMVISLFNWGLGLVFGSILARTIGEKSIRDGFAISYPVIGAAAYSGLLVWHGGFSGSAPLTVATADHFLQDQTGIIAVSSTILSWQNLLTNGLMILVVLGLMLILAGRTTTQPVDLTPSEPETQVTPGKMTFNDRLDQSRVLILLLGGIIVLYVGYLAVTQADSLAFINLNTVNLLLLGLGLMLHRNVVSYSRHFENDLRSAAGIVLLFPFYAGIMGIMKSSGLTTEISNFIASSASPDTFPMYAFLSSGLVNLFVPSGGGQWVVQGPILVDAAIQNGVGLPQVIMAFSYGDEWTNMLQPFWALPLLGITRLKAREILPYTILMMLLAAPVFMLGIYLF